MMARGSVGDSLEGSGGSEQLRIVLTGSGPRVWAVLVVASIVFMMAGLWRRVFFGYTPIPVFVEDLRVGNQLLLIGSAFSLGASITAWVQRYPRWIAVCVAAPAILIGGVALVSYPNLAPHAAAVFALPAALAGLLGGLTRDVSRPR